MQAGNCQHCAGVSPRLFCGGAAVQQARLHQGRAKEQRAWGAHLNACLMQCIWDLHKFPYSKAMIVKVNCHSVIWPLQAPGQNFGLRIFFLGATHISAQSSLCSCATHSQTLIEALLMLQSLLCRQASLCSLWSVCCTLAGLLATLTSCCGRPRRSATRTAKSRRGRFC